MVRKRSLIVRYEILLGIFVNRWFATDKYFLHKRENLIQVIQIEISQKRKAFGGILFVFLKFKLNLKHFEKKPERHTLSIFEIIASERRDYLNVSKMPFQSTLWQSTW